ncbi:MAG: type II secretion system protein [Planctomycetes bacterium]|nr:type II secretion system protein [Planctomycetota bacterium]
MPRRGPTHGFTLIEVLIVVIIMAVLAATVIPQFANSTVDAKLGALRYNLSTLRKQIETYKAHHDSRVPEVDGTTGTLQQLLSSTDTSGTIGVGASFRYGPYLINELPQNPFTSSNAVREVTTWPPSASGNGGWVYNSLTGQIAADDPDHIGL